MPTVPSMFRAASTLVKADYYGYLNATSCLSQPSSMFSISARRKPTRDGLRNRFPSHWPFIS